MYLLGKAFCFKTDYFYLIKRLIFQPLGPLILTVDGCSRHTRQETVIGFELTKPTLDFLAAQVPSTNTGISLLNVRVTILWLCSFQEHFN